MLSSMDASIVPLLMIHGWHVEIDVVLWIPINAAVATDGGCKCKLIR